MRHAAGWIVHGALCIGVLFLGSEAVEGQTADVPEVAGSYAICSEAWGHWEALSLDRSGFRHIRTIHKSEKAVHTGHYNIRDSRLVIVADSGPGVPEDIVIGGPTRFDSLTFVVDTVATTPVLWRSTEFQSAYRGSGTLNEYGVLVRVGPPSDTIGAPQCRDEFGGPFDERPDEFRR